MMDGYVISPVSTTALFYIMFKFLQNRCSFSVFEIFDSKWIITVYVILFSCLYFLIWYYV